jgi:hypothetical protein
LKAAFPCLSLPPAASALHPSHKISYLSLSLSKLLLHPRPLQPLIYSKCNQALIVSFGDNSHAIRELMRFIELTNR